MQVEFMRPFFPYGRCLKVTPDRKVKDIAYVILEFDRQIGPDDGRFKIFLTNPSTENHLFSQPSELQGQEIIIDSQFPKNQWTVKTSMNVHEKDDPNYACVEYAEGFTYETCVEEEFVLKIEKALNCTPHWLISRDTQMVCKTNLNVSDVPEEYTRDMESFWREFKPLGCKLPCKTLSYESSHAFQYESVKIENRKTVLSTVLQFEALVLVKKSSFSISPQTLLTRIGGSIGFGRTCFWLMVAAYACVKTSTSVIQSFRTFAQPNQPQLQLGGPDS
jgi:hypothetical protein